MINRHKNNSQLGTVLGILLVVILNIGKIFGVKVSPTDLQIALNLLSDLLDAVTRVVQ